MKIKLLYPPANRSFGSIISPSYHIAILGAILKKHNYKVAADDLEIKLAYLKKFKRFELDTNAMIDFQKVILYLKGGKTDYALSKTLKTLLKLTDYSGYDIFGFQVNTLQQFCVNQLASALCCAKYLKENTKAKMFLFGHYPSEYAKNLIKKFSFIDGVLHFDPEVSIIQMIKTFEKYNNKIYPNLFYRKNNMIYGDGRIEKINLNKLPCPEFNILPVNLYRSFHNLVLPYEITRGCPNNCFFCNYIYKIEDGRSKKAEKVLYELKNLCHNYGTNKFHFLDSSVTNYLEIYTEIFKRIKQSNMNIEWTALSTPKSSLTNSFFRLLKASGCKLLRWGVESGSEKILKTFSKKLSVKIIEQNLKLSHDNGIYNHISLMVNLPSENRNDFLKTLKFIERNHGYIDSANVIPFGSYDPVWLEKTIDWHKIKNYSQNSNLGNRLTKFLERYNIFHEDSIRITAEWK